MSLKPLFGGKRQRKLVIDSVVPEGMKGGVFYIRVSTGKQEEKGNGLESQKEIIKEFAEKNDVFQIGDFHIEIGSGGAALDKRPILSEAIEIAKRHDAYLITSKLDRLSRKAAMVSNMLEDNFKFVTVEHGFQAEHLFIRILAALAQKERELIGERTSAGLKQVAKRYEEEYQAQVAAGVENPVRKKLGIPSVKDAPTHISHIRRQQGEERSQKYVDEMINPTIEELKLENNGKVPNRKIIAERMNRKGFKTDYGSEWSESIIYHTLKKLNRKKARNRSKSRSIARSRARSRTRSPPVVVKPRDPTSEPITEPEPEPEPEIEEKDQEDTSNDNISSSTAEDEESETEEYYEEITFDEE